MLARHPRRLAGAFALLALVAGPAARALGSPQLALPTGGQAPAPTATMARPANPRLEARKAPKLQLSAEWTIELPSPPAPGVAVDGARGYVVQQPSTLVALALNDGTVAWTLAVDRVVGPLEAGDGCVFLAHADGIEAIDAATGKRRWQVDAGARVSAPILWTRTGLVVATDRAVVMLRTATGEVAWSHALKVPAHLQPATDGDRVYFALDGGPVLAVTLATGLAAWETPLPVPPTTIDAGGGRVFVGGSDKYLYCFSADRGTRKWRWRNGGAPVGRVAVDRHHVYFAALDNVLRALDRSRGQQIWKAPLAHRPLGGVILGSRLLWVPGVAGEVAAYQTVDGSAAGLSPLAGDPISAPEARFSAADSLDGEFVVSGDGLAQWLVPRPPPLAAKPIPWVPTGVPDVWGGVSNGGQPIAGAF